MLSVALYHKYDFHGNDKYTTVHHELYRQFTFT